MLLLAGNAACQPLFVEMPAITESDRILIFAPHPDDEIIGCAGIIQHALEKGATIKIVFLTNGDHNQVAFKIYKKQIIMRPESYRKMGELRRQESLVAGKSLGLSDSQLLFLGYPDYGTMEIWLKHWGNIKPFKSSLTNVNRVPYPENPSYKKAYTGENILSDITTVLKSFKPTRIFATHPGDTNTDHRALYNFVQLGLLETGYTEPNNLHLYLVHSRRWPKPSGFLPTEMLTPPDRLQTHAYQWEVFSVPEEHLLKKASALEVFKSQLIGRKNFFLSFVRKNELFGKVPWITLPVTTSEISIETKNEGELSEEMEVKHTRICEIGISSNQKNVLLSVKAKRVVFERDFYVELRLYGWKNNLPFAEMPKLVMETDLSGKSRVYNGTKQARHPQLKIESVGNDTIFTIPRELLGNPEFLFLGGENKLGALTLDFLPWRVFKASGT
ncbi:MAG: PIG-L family deacetylase [Candidatus Ratteibacteria bacterium]